MRLLILSLGLAICAACQSPNPHSTMNSVDTPAAAPASFETYWASLQDDMMAIPNGRQEALLELSSFVRRQLAEHDTAELIFICTHNSRRSHLGQIWAQIAADQLGIQGVKTYSGGTEATAFNARAVESLMRAYVNVEPPNFISENPPYRIHLPSGKGSFECWSKTYDDAANPNGGFGAIMTCSEADAACPNVSGAQFRLSLPYVDPKVSDGTGAEDSTYDARCRQIAAEMRWAFEQIKH